jgi:hypothetical protein
VEIPDDRTDPEKAVDEIKEICAKYDLACLAVISSLDDVAFVRRIDPSWSCAWMEPVPGDKDGTVAVRIRSRLKEDYGGDKERQKREINGTTGMFIAFLNWAEETREHMTQITALLAKHFPQILHHEKWRRGKW